MSDTVIPQDAFSRRRRELGDNPGAIGAGSTIPMKDFYGNFQSWIVETYRADGEETVFLSVNDAEGGRRLVLPPQVTAAMYRQRDQLVTRSRRRTARQTVAMRKERGDTLGNPEALRKARRSKKRR